ncbi:flavin reductase family protein [Ruicaihuangia caeni]|uniref:Flavin reductase family protein n=1 Tax=Ruicaihuangia caeni TaxID=3042517 RepID=A0AAW6T6R3_9MICO|nr:flavin reductase family protein [Klugiella sp. YN-L-19]MDI2098919.1 flavin reductase family protein [Klugiella sp. YN-L-19]
MNTTAIGHTRRKDSAARTPEKHDELIAIVKAANRSLPTGVSVVTGRDAERPVGLVVNAYSSVSLEPASVLVCVNRSSSSHDYLHASPFIAVNFLAHDQEEIARRFAVSGGDKFADLDWHPGVNGSPLLAGTSAHFEIEVDERLAAHTHTIFIGRIVDAMTHGSEPLLYKDGRFHDIF